MPAAPAADAAPCCLRRLSPAASASISTRNDCLFALSRFWLSCVSVLKTNTPRKPPPIRSLACLLLCCNQPWAELSKSASASQPVSGGGVKQVACHLVMWPRCGPRGGCALLPSPTNHLHMPIYASAIACLPALLLADTGRARRQTVLPCTRRAWAARAAPGLLYYPQSANFRQAGRQAGTHTASFAPAVGCLQSFLQWH